MGTLTKYDTGERNTLDVVDAKLVAYSSLYYVIFMLGTDKII
jgi:hypothetical protein